MPPALAFQSSNRRLPASFLRQRLNLEYSTIVHSPLPSIYLSPTPTSQSHASQSGPQTWTGIFLPRSGPYAPSGLRFTIVFPPLYPVLPPRVLFTTEVFHPLVVPLSTYRYSYSNTTTVIGSTNGSEKDGDGSDTEDGAEEKQELEPGEFNLRYGLKRWFDEARRERVRSASRYQSREGSRQVSGESNKSAATMGTDGSGINSGISGGSYRTAYKYGVRDVLVYMTDAFTKLNETLLHVPLESAANPSAWLAWRSWRATELGIEDDKLKEDAVGGVGTGDGGNRPSSKGDGGVEEKRSSSAKRPEQWDWTNVFLERVRRSCEASLSDAALYGSGSGSGGDDLIRFLDMESEDLEKVRGVVMGMGERVMGSAS